MSNIDAINLGFIFGCGVLVIFMQVGFAMLEPGLNSHVHAVNILFKNLIDLCIGACVYYAIGYRIMWPERFAAHDPFFGIPHNAGAGIEWFYQVAFAATSTTIVSGAVAGRMRFKAYLAYTVFISGLVYPVIGRLLWSKTGFSAFHDFAGSIVVHGVGGVTALAAVMILRPRIDRFNPGFIPHHNLPLSVLGAMILWVGWYGFNGGSVPFLIGQNDESTQSAIYKLSGVIVNTTLGAATGAIAGMIFGLFPNRGVLSLKAAINGSLGGLVSITASCDAINALEACVIGTVAGFLVIVGEAFLEEMKWDDTVGAFPVHGVCGIWGGIAVALSDNSAYTLKTQLVGILFLGGVFIVMMMFFSILKFFNWLEVSPEEERRGLDAVEHNVRAYHPCP